MGSSPSSFQIPDPLFKSWQKLQESRRKRLSPRQVQRMAGLAHEIWLAYTKDRRALGRLPLTSPDFALAYHLAFHLPNMARQLIPFERMKLQMDSWFLSQGLREVSVLDLGCGSGASSLAVAYAIDPYLSAPGTITFQLFDRSHHLLSLAEDSLRSLKLKSAISIDSQNLQIGRDGLKLKFPDHNGLFIVCLSYSWNELAKNKRSRTDVLNILKVAQKRQAPTWFLLSEPSSQHQALTAMELRNELVRLGWNSIYPCPNNKPCPMLMNGKDWCFSELPFRSPPILERWLPGMDRSQKILGCASYWFSNDVAPLPRSPSPRIVGRPMQGRRAWLLLCDQDGIQKKEVFNKLPLRAWAQRQPRGITISPKKAAPKNHV